MGKITVLTMAALISSALSPAASLDVPQNFPRFEVPGHEDSMAALRHMFYQHYLEAGPKATLWDEWLASPSLWPAYTREGSVPMRDQWHAALSNRHIDQEGYVATHQHRSIAHQTGWPFPHWSQGRKGFGYHFSFRDTSGPPWRSTHLASPEAWETDGAKSFGVSDQGWELSLTTASATLTTPADAKPFLPYESPFVQLRWRSPGLEKAQPFLEWETRESAGFAPDRRMYFDPPDPGRDNMTYSMLPLFEHPAWKGEITRLRLNFGNEEPVTSVTVQALFSQYDTRHNVNNQSYLAGCTDYFWWSRDLNFLRDNLNRMRTALQFIILDGQTQKEKVVLTGWVGHEGRSGLRRRDDGTIEILTGTGVGNNYWDLLPFGHKDAYATLRFYSTLLRMAQLEEEVASHPQWNLPRSVVRHDPEYLRRHAAEVKQRGNELFWNDETGRFAAGIDADGHKPDFGFTFVNLEAIYYGFATDAHARTILEWLTGQREVEGDTSKGDDIYAWRFGPRATTRRNLDYYGWYWHNPGSIPFGGQVQDGGAVLGFSYHDLMARLKYLGPNDAWNRLQQILTWYQEVLKAGGYRKYYDGSRPGDLQGGGTPGGLGMDEEFYESVLVPQVLLEGFLGFRPTGSGFRIHPRLPASWPELTITRIHLHRHVLNVRATTALIEITREGLPPGAEPSRIDLEEGSWDAEWSESPAKQEGLTRISPTTWDVSWRAGSVLRLIRTDLPLHSQ